MGKKAKYRKIQSNNIYIPEELGKEVNLSTATIYRHIRNGLKADKGVKPYLIYGKHAKEYFRNLYTKDKIEISKDEIHCNVCGKISTIKDTFERIVSTGLSYSKNKDQVQILGYCSYCSSRYSRFKSFISNRKLERGVPISIDMLTGSDKNEI